jgi:hypothetical protein
LGTHGDRAAKAYVAVAALAENEAEIARTEARIAELQRAEAGAVESYGERKRLLRAECDAVQAERDGLQAECDGLRGELAEARTILAERDVFRRRIAEL